MVPKGLPQELAGTQEWGRLLEFPQLWGSVGQDSQARMAGQVECS